MNVMTERHFDETWSICNYHYSKQSPSHIKRFATGTSNYTTFLNLTSISTHIICECENNIAYIALQEQITVHDYALFFVRGLWPWCYGCHLSIIIIIIYALFSASKAMHIQKIPKFMNHKHNII